MIFIYHFTLTFFLYLKIRAMSLNRAGTTPAAISTMSQRLRKENPRKRPSVPPVIQSLNTVDCKMCPHQTLPPEIPVCRPASPSPRASRGTCSTQWAETSPAFPEGRHSSFVLQPFYLLQLLRPIGICIRQKGKVDSNRSCWTLQAESMTWWCQIWLEAAWENKTTFKSRLIF